MLEVNLMMRIGYTLNANVISTFLSIVVAMSCMFSLIVPSGYTLGYALVLLASIPLLLIRSNPVKLSGSSRLFIGSLLGFFLLHTIGNLKHGSALRSYDESAHYLFSIPIFWLLCKYPLKRMYWWAGISLGAIAGGMFAILQVFFLGYFRAEGFMVAIQFGDLCVLFGALCLIGIGGVYKHQAAQLWLVLLGLGAVMGLVGSLLSGARGGWLVVPFVFVVIFISYSKQDYRRFVVRALVVGALALVAMYWVPQAGIERRVASTVSDYQNYLSGDEVDTSLGVRLEMWRLSTTLIAQRPIFGWGGSSYKTPMLALIKNNRVKETISVFDHVHNDVLDVLIKRGLVGLLALILIFIIPVGLFLKHVNHENMEVKSFAVAGVILVLCVFIFGLTQTFFIHNSGVTIYAFILVVLWSCLQEVVEVSKKSDSKESGYE